MINISNLKKRCPKCKSFRFWYDAESDQVICRNCATISKEADLIVTDAAIPNGKCEIWTVMDANLLELTEEEKAQKKKAKVTDPTPVNLKSRNFVQKMQAKFNITTGNNTTVTVEIVYDKKQAQIREDKLMKALNRFYPTDAIKSIKVKE